MAGSDRDTASGHRPVLCDEAVAALAVRPEGAYIDATFGRGGHTQAILSRLGARGRLLAIDRDPQAMATAAALAASDARVACARGDFAMMDALSAGWRPAQGVDGILLDLGVSSPQLEQAERGFAFRQDGPLDMRMDPQQGEAAADWLARVPVDELEQAIRTLGEERFARRVARAIDRARQEQAITGTARLAAIVAAAVPGNKREQHPATRTFQAIRMAVNGELEALDAALAAVPGLLAPGGRLAVISFHSLEDRRVKRFIRAASGGAPTPARDHRGRVPPVAEAVRPAQLQAIGRSTVPDDAEVETNPRARSARLRVAECPS